MLREAKYHSWHSASRVFRENNALEINHLNPYAYGDLVSAPRAPDCLTFDVADAYTRKRQVRLQMKNNNFSEKI